MIVSLCSKKAAAIRRADRAWRIGGANLFAKLAWCIAFETAWAIDTPNKNVIYSSQGAKGAQLPNKRPREEFRLKIGLTLIDLIIEIERKKIYLVYWIYLIHATLIEKFNSHAFC